MLAKERVSLDAAASLGSALLNAGETSPRRDDKQRDDRRRRDYAPIDLHTLESVRERGRERKGATGCVVADH